MLLKTSSRALPVSVYSTQVFHFLEQYWLFICLSKCLLQLKLLTKQGVIKAETDCAPNNGYFLIPCYGKVQYIMFLKLLWILCYPLHVYVFWSSQLLSDLHFKPTNCTSLEWKDREKNLEMILAWFWPTVQHTVNIITELWWNYKDKKGHKFWSLEK